MSGKHVRVAKEQNKKFKRISMYERNQQITSHKIRVKKMYIKQNYDDLTERELRNENKQLFYLNKYYDFLSKKLERNRV